MSTEIAEIVKLSGSVICLATSAGGLLVVINVDLSTVIVHISLFNMSKRSAYFKHSKNQEKLTNCGTGVADVLANLAGKL